MIEAKVSPYSQNGLLVEEMIARYSAGLPSEPGAKDDSKNHSGVVVLLTGSTGNLGSEILRLLCDDNSNVTKVYALNRRSSKQTIYERHAAQLGAKGVDGGFLRSPRLVFLEGDTALPNFDLDIDVYEEVCLCC